jgi:alpha-tubulin suppressor-like RCC1 family protein
MTHRRRRRRILSNALTLGLAAAGMVAMPAAAQASPLLRGHQAQVAAAWGDNEYGNLGDGTLMQRLAAVGVGSLTNVSQVAAGQVHSLAVTSDGSVWSWGRNTFGQLGTGAAGLSKSPQLVSGISGTITHVAAGWTHSLALGSDGTVWAWGDNRDGELGDGNTITQIAAGAEFGMAVQTTVKLGFLRHSLLTWGQETWGQVGNGQLMDPESPGGVINPYQVTGIPAPAAIAAGTDSAMMVGTDGSVWGWGQDLYGNLGVGSGDGILYSPTQTLNPGSGIIQLAAGYDYVLGLRSDGTVVAWGYNSSGQLGDGTTTTSVIPVQVSGLSGVSQVSAGVDYSFAVHTIGYILRSMSRQA